MQNENLKFTNELIDFINNTPTAFHATENSAKMLTDNGFTRLDASAPFSVTSGEKYFLTRGGSSLIAFKIPADTSNISFTIGAAHGDSPAFKVKPSSTLEASKYISVAVEKYGGSILQTWFDRPLSVAGRIVVRDGDAVISKNVNVEKDLLIIPNIPPHLGSTKEPSMLSDMIPLLGEKPASIENTVAEAAGVSPDDILSHDLFVYNRQKGTLLGANGEFFGAPRIDDLECAYSLLCGFIEADIKNSIPVFAIFDNEETGSSSRQGAASTFLPETLLRIVKSLGGDEDSYYASLASSFLLSADNAHAKHPSHGELFDRLNAPTMNEGIVIKTNSSQRYTTDAVSFAVVKMLCEKAGVPCQNYANRADLPGGSTLGNIALHNTPVLCADIGLAQLAMHSSFESAGTLDGLYLKKMAKVMFESKISAVSDCGYSIK